jgi:hypothetical protein
LHNLRKLITHTENFITKKKRALSPFHRLPVKSQRFCVTEFKMPKSAMSGIRAQAAISGAAEWRDFEPSAKDPSEDPIHQEFALRRDRIVAVGRGKPIIRLAAFLITLSNRNRAEGHDPALIDDQLDCTVIADYLGLSVDLLALSLMQLKLRGLVEAAPDRAIRLTDLRALEGVADGVSEAPHAADTVADHDDAVENLDVGAREAPLCYARQKTSEAMPPVRANTLLGFLGITPAGHS